MSNSLLVGKYKEKTEELVNLLDKNNNHASFRAIHSFLKKGDRRVSHTNNANLVTECISLHNQINANKNKTNSLSKLLKNKIDSNKIDVKKLAEGGFGAAYELSDKDYPKKGVVVKLFKITEKSDILNELLMHIKMNKIGLGPTLYSALQCNNKVICVMERFDGDLIGKRDNNKILNYLNKNVSPDVLRDLISQVDTLHKNNYIHMDILPKNIFAKFDNGQVTTAKISDFGTVFKITKTTHKNFIRMNLKNFIPFYIVNDALATDHYKDKKFFFDTFVFGNMILDFTDVNKFMDEYNKQTDNSSKVIGNILEEFSNNPKVVDYITLYNMSVLLPRCEEIKNELTKFINTIIPKNRHYEMGKLMIGVYKNGEKDGEWKIYNKKGQLEEILNFENGKLNGLVKAFYPNGKLKKIGSYINDVATGEWKFYHDNGLLKIKTLIDDGKMTGMWKKYNEYGKLAETGFHKNGKTTGKWKLYNANGKLEEKGLLENGKKTGRWEIYKNGVLNETAFYENGKIVNSNNSSPHGAK